MPYLSIQTNQSVDVESLVTEASAMIAEMLDKPESFVMVALSPDTPMSFGAGAAPTAFVRLYSIGLPLDRCPEFSEKICEFLESRLSIPANRVFIAFRDLDRRTFGWNGKTFA